ncbi:glycosyltransferase family 1 protein [Halostreptopolyspora alba]|uniref:Glycosyltransferase family 1 protein n=2 Tax=Halostreptopolyspora alba TaxID=2487137 RepID=A0A3N0EG39_9ACTN|nr:glycosyltransferase family 1 protein [Nocardiopsaceae bacterium YIM 96095]
MAQRTMLITNDFPPRTGGIETFGYELARRIPGAGNGSVLVYTSSSVGQREFDRAQPFAVVRDPASTLLPTPRIARKAADLVREHGCDRVVFGAAAPLGLLARGLRAAGAGEIVALTHGHEAWWSRLPGVRLTLRRIGRDVDVLTYLGDYTRDVLYGALGDTARHRLVRLAPGVDTGLFHPERDGLPVRERYGLGSGPVILTACRLVARKGVDTLIRAMSWVRVRHPRARLLVVGEGPDGRRLRELARWMGVDGEVVFVGAHPHEDMPGFFAAADLFAMPCRSRRAGLEAEGLGIAFLEAAASGVPVLAGNSGGAPEAVRHGETGYVVDGRDPGEVARRVSRVLDSPEHARAMGLSGREWMTQEWTWERTARRLEFPHG